MTTEPAGAYFANANSGFATAIWARLLTKSIFLKLTGFTWQDDALALNTTARAFVEMPHANN